MNTFHSIYVPGSLFMIILNTPAEPSHEVSLIPARQGLDHRAPKTYCPLRAY